jgi:hypothetical protein
LKRTATYLEQLAYAGALRIDTSEQAMRTAASRFIALVQGQMVFSAACGGEYSARDRAAHVDAAVEGFLAIYESR